MAESITPGIASVRAGVLSEEEREGRDRWSGVRAAARSVGNPQVWPGWALRIPGMHRGRGVGRELEEAFFRSAIPGPCLWWS